MSVNLVVSTSLYVAVGAPNLEAGFSYGVLPYVEIGEVVDISEYGPEAGVSDHQPLKSGVTIKRKGFTNNGNMVLQLGNDISDAGQAVLKSGVDGPTKYKLHSFKIVHQDGFSQYFQCYIHSFTNNLSGGDSISGASSRVEITSRVLDVEPEDPIDDFAIMAAASPYRMHHNPVKQDVLSRLIYGVIFNSQADSF